MTASFHGNILLAVEHDRDRLAGKLDAQRVPLIAGHWRVDILYGDPPAALRVIERYVVFERVGAGDVVVVGVLEAPYETARLVLAAGKRLEFHFDKAVRNLRGLLHAPRKGAFAGLLQDIRLAWR
jgi:hypothetical protein